MEVVIGVASLLVILAVVAVLWRQPHPGETDEPERAHQGPTGEPYPSGSRPAGPGAESQRPDGRPVEPAEPDND